MRVLLLLRGSPGCGKSTWIRENGLEAYALSADNLRMMSAAPRLNADGSFSVDQSNDKFVWETLFNILEVRMKNGEFTVIDATNSKTSEIERYKKLCDTYRYRMYCVDFTDLPIETAKERNAARDPLKRVPDEAIDKMYARFATQKIPSGVTVIKPDELDRIWLKKLDLSSWKKIHVIGDIHGCSTALRHYLEAGGGLHEDEFYIFCGDYIDRGLENADVVHCLCELARQPNVYLMEGNHDRWLWNWANNEVCPSQEFEFHTSAQLEDAHIDKKMVRQLYRRFGQCSWFHYAGNDWLITHAGLSTVPENLTLIAASQMIRGVGGYRDTQQVEESFDRSTAENCFQIHGHRNLAELPINSGTRSYNLEGKVEFGGCLRVLELCQNGSVRTVEIKNDVFRHPEQELSVAADEQSNTVADLILELRRNTYVNEKRYGNISSFNFSKSAFYAKVWDAQTVRARGLYVNVPRQKIVARAYDKFFNINERPETKLDALSRKLRFPLSVSVKENGFLGIAAYNEEDDALLITTKSSPDGDYAQWLREDMLKLLGEDTLARIKDISREKNVSFVFECVDMERDPHIITYPESSLYLLDVIYNDMHFRKLPYAELASMAAELGIRCKEHACTIDSWQEFLDWYTAVTAEDYRYNGRHIEGFVIEDASGYMIKLKLHYYNMWKFLRGISHEVIRRCALDGSKTSSLTTPLANHYYAWIRAWRAEHEPEDIPTDICSLRKLFVQSETGKGFADVC